MNLGDMIAGLGLPRPVAEYRFHPVRRWRFDWAWVEQKLALEIDGGAWTGGRHARGYGIESDCEKFCEATLLGWRVLRVTPRMVKNGSAFTYIEKALNHGMGKHDELLAFVSNLQRIVTGFADRIAAQSELLSKRAMRGGQSM